ncbi:MAG TPA: AP2 domain-containing protein [Tissierellales bacterium]|nr:AP2 domain-containing protein [Tissierellales bacterium]
MFKEIPVTKEKINKRKLVHGVGINDSPYRVSRMIRGKTETCGYFKVWAGMLGRCYSRSIQSKNPTYIGCTVEPSWLRFTNFKAWMENQVWRRNQLDKDILNPGNKHYGPNTCIFVDPSINKLLNTNEKQRGKYPQGVTAVRNKGPITYKATISKFNKYCQLGIFKTVEQAEQAYLKHKRSYIKQVIKIVDDPRLKQGLQQHLKRYSSN